MANFRPIVRQVHQVVTYQVAEYGRVRVKLAEMLEQKGLTRNKLQTLTGTNYAVINRYYRSEIKRVDMVDLDFLARVCYVLECRVEDLLEYLPPEEDAEAAENPRDGGSA